MNTNSRAVQPGYVYCTEASTTAQISPRKLNLVAEAIRNKDAQFALGQLKFMKVRSAPIVAKVLKSAMANATHNCGVEESMTVLLATVGSKGSLKRARPGSHGRAMPIRKPYAGIRIVLGRKDGE